MPRVPDYGVTQHSHSFVGAFELESIAPKNLHHLAPAQYNISSYVKGVKLAEGMAGAVYRAKRVPSKSNAFDFVLKYSTVKAKPFLQLKTELDHEIEIMTELSNPGHRNVMKLEDTFIDQTTQLPVIVAPFLREKISFNGFNATNQSCS